MLLETDRRGVRWGPSTIVVHIIFLAVSVSVLLAVSQTCVANRKKTLYFLHESRKRIKKAFLFSLSLSR